MHKGQLLLFVIHSWIFCFSNECPHVVRTQGSCIISNFNKKFTMSDWTGHKFLEIIIIIYISFCESVFLLFLSFTRSLLLSPILRLEKFANNKTNACSKEGSDSEYSCCWSWLLSFSHGHFCFIYFLLIIYTNSTIV